MGMLIFSWLIWFTWDHSVLSQIISGNFHSALMYIATKINTINITFLLFQIIIGTKHEWIGKIIAIILIVPTGFLELSFRVSYFGLGWWSHPPYFGLGWWFK
jgi:hypothetical protein